MKNPFLLPPAFRNSFCSTTSLTVININFQYIYIAPIKCILLDTFHKSFNTSHNLEIINSMNDFYSS